MGKGTGIKDMPKIEGIAMAGKIHGGGVKLAHGTKKESDMQEKKNLLNENAIDDTATSMATPKVHSGSFSTGNFMATPKYKGTAKKGKTARGKEHQEKIHGNKPGYYEPKTGLIKVKNETI
jgi:hypothetical protein